MHMDCLLPRAAPGRTGDRKRRTPLDPEVIILRDVQNHISPDADIMQRVAQADHKAFLVLYDRYASRVYGLALRMMGNAMAAEDVAQEAFLKVWNRAGSFKPDRGSLAAWLLTITRRTALDRIRADARRTSPGDPFDPEAVLLDLPDPQTSSSEARWRSLRLMLTDLPSEQTQVIDLAFFGGLSHSQIAERLQLPLGTVKTRLRLGMEKLRQAWLASEFSDRDRSSSVSGDVKHTRKASQAR
jgi:RNA polymerase sigma-70 factor (ECF subfamily)